MRAVCVVAMLLILGCEASVRLDDGEGDEPQGAADPGWSIPPGQVRTQLYCVLPEPDIVVPMLDVTIWPTAPTTCDPTEVVGWPAEPLLSLYIVDWDFSSGDFVIGEPSPHGTASANWWPDQSPAQTYAVTGIIAVEPFADLPEVVSWDLDLAAGRADISVCSTVSKDFAVCAQP